MAFLHWMLFLLLLRCVSAISFNDLVQTTSFSELESGVCFLQHSSGRRIPADPGRTRVQDLPDDHFSQADEELVQEDAKLEREDASLRMQIQQLTRENALLTDALGLLSPQKKKLPKPSGVEGTTLDALKPLLTSAATDAELRHGGDAQIVTEDVQSIVSLLLATNDTKVLATEPNGNSSVNPSNITPSAGLSSDNQSTVASVIADGGSNLWLVLGSIGAVVVLVLIWLGRDMYFFFGHRNEDVDGDGDVDIQDFKEFMSNKTCGLSWMGMKGLAMVFMFAVVGFAVLWYFQIIQPFMKELTCYFYLLFVMSMIMGVVATELWVQFMAMFGVQTKLFEKLQKLFPDVKDTFSLVGGTTRGRPGCC